MPERQWPPRWPWSRLELVRVAGGDFHLQPLFWCGGAGVVYGGNKPVGWRKALGYPSRRQRRSSVATTARGAATTGMTLS